MAKKNIKDTITEIDGVPVINLQEGYVKKQTLAEKLEQLKKLDHIQFEHYISRLLAIKGYEVKFTPVVDDGGCDMVVSRKGQVTAVRCLLSKELVGKDKIEETLSALNNYLAHDTMLITDNFFTREALRFAKKKPIILVDRKGLIDDFLKLSV